MTSISGISSAEGLASLMAGSGNQIDISNSSGQALSAVMTSGKLASTLTTAKVDAAAKDFESMFISQMIESMFGDSTGDEAFGSGETKEVYKGLLMDQYGKAIAKSGGIGIASFIKKELLKEQEIQHEHAKATGTRA